MRTSRQNTGRRGVTLVELLVATALTLMLVAALAQAFSVIGTTIARNRAAVQMQGQLRGVGLRLQRDLEGVTVPMRPWSKASSGLGYFKYEEGWAHDGWLFPGLNPPGTSGAGTRTPGVTHFGDADDILMFTSRSREAPFVGVRQVPGVIAGSLGLATFESSLAEVIWWATLTDENGDNSIVPNTVENEEYVIYRRALLIRPDLNTGVDPAQVRRYYSVFPSATTWTDTTDQVHLRNLRAYIKGFMSANDLSVRFERQDNPSNPNEVRTYVVANSLDDLAKPENRFAHSPIVRINPALTAPNNLQYVPQGFPFRIDHDLGRNSVTRIPAIRAAFPAVPDSEPGVIKSGDQQGEDVMLGHALAFDVRVFDPLAFVGAHPGRDGGWGVAGVDDNGAGGPDDFAEAGWPNSDDELVTPGDPGYSALPPVPPAVSVSLSSSTPTSAPNRAVLPTGRGAYVDLAYTLKWIKAATGDHCYNRLDGITGPYPNPLNPLASNSPADLPANPSRIRYYSHFSGMPLPPAAPYAAGIPNYDTWTFHYEHDGINQDGDRWDHDNNSATPPVSLIDEGTNGFDNFSWFNPGSTTPQVANPSNGVDDVGERETSPPYPVPLRGIQVKIRVYDAGTRQVRQITVVSDFTPD